MTESRSIVCTVHRCRNFAAVTATIFLCAVPARSQQGGLDARARAALEEMQAAYKSVQALHLKINSTARYTGSISSDDFPLPGPDILELRMERPNKFFMSASRKSGSRTLSYLVVSDGTSLWYWRSGTNTYTQAKAPATLTGMAPLLPRDAIGTLDGNTWEADSITEWDFLTGEFPAVNEFGPPGATVTMGGPEKLGDVAVTVVRIRGSVGMTVESDIHLDLENHLIRGTTLAVRGKHPENGRDFSVSMQSVYEIHNARPRFGPADFVFTPPPGAKLVNAR